METKQTAVDWLYSEFNKCIIGRSEKSGIEILQEAKAMEKEQIMKAFEINYDYPDGIAASERYYKRKYGSI